MQPEAPTHHQFFGDSERDFSLPPQLLLELERVTATGIGALAKRLFAGQFGLRDVHEVIRLALIGGGESPQSAASLVDAYVAPRPIMEGYALAVSILETAMLGSTAKPKKGGRK